MHYHEFNANFTSKSSGVAVIVNRAFNARRIDSLAITTKIKSSAIILLPIEVSNPAVANGHPAAYPFVIAGAYIKPSASESEQRIMIKRLIN